MIQDRRSSATGPHLRDVRAVIPAELKQPDRRRAAGVVALVTAQAVVATVLAAVVWAQGWWFAAPLTWVLGSIAACSLFVAGHDCAHGSFLRSRRAMEIIGHLCMAPVLYPMRAWKYSHDAHHRETNRLGGGEGIYFDNAWSPRSEADFTRMCEDQKLSAGLYRMIRLVPPVGSFLHLIGYHWRPGLFRSHHRRRVVRSMAATLMIDAGIVGVIWASTGSVLAIAHFWLLPALGFHAWMALYTFLHHTADDIVFLDQDRWTPIAGQLDGTVNCLAPRWLSFLHLNIDVHIPHHVTTSVPSYHLRAANEAIRASEFGARMTERRLTLAYLRRTVRDCQLWRSDNDNYVRFADQPRP